MKALQHLIAAILVIVGVASVAAAVAPSGPGQTTAAHSVSVVFASDATMPAVSVTGGATAANQTTLNGFVDGLETLVTATNASLALLKQPTLSVAVTASDSTDLTATCTKGLWVGTTGNLSVKLAGDSSATTWKNLPSGTYVPGAYARVMAATTAADIVCLSGP